MLKKIRQTLNKKGGFSLIELLVVIAIMGVIALVAIPNVVSALDKSKINTDRTNASAIATAITTARADGVSVTATSGKVAFSSISSSIVPKYLQSVPTAKYSSSTDKVFYVTVSSDGLVEVFAKIDATPTYKEIFPTPETDSPWVD
jgi:prepilin-type N-terminal cleavage/methylation domain